VPAQSKLNLEHLPTIREALARGDSQRTIAASLGVSAGTVRRALTKLTKIADRVRAPEEFAAAIAAVFRAPVRQQSGAYTWTLEAIRSARDLQMDGDFKQPVKLARAMRTDDALYVAYHNRIAPQSAIATALEPSSGARGEACARRAYAGVFVPKSTLASINGTLADHGIAIGFNEQEIDPDGTRVDFRLTEWPLEHVKWNASREVLETATRDGTREVITHGNGRWVVFRKFDVLPWQQEACVLPAALLWAAHANGIKDWAAASTSHGQAKIIAELPAGIALQSAVGAQSAEALAVLTVLQDIMSGESGAGILPAGSKTTFLANGSNAWQVFSELILNREKAAARIYLGTDAMLGSQGGAPGVDIAALFGVATTKVQADFRAIEQALNVGVYQPWAAVNEGSSRYAPSFRYLMPDSDAEAKSAEVHARRERLFETLEKYKAASMTITQAVVDALAKEYGVDEVPQLAPAASASVPLDLAPTSLDSIVRGREGRAAKGLPPFGDARDDQTITRIKAESEAAAQIRVDDAEKAPEGAAPPPVEETPPETEPAV
jgi:hypothetical protein